MEAEALPMLAQLFIGISTPVSVLGLMWWTIHQGRHKLDITDADRRKVEIQEAVNREVNNLTAQLTVMRAQLAEEKQDCKESTNKLEARVERYEQRLHTAESEKNKLGTQVAELKGKQFVMERMMPQFDVLLGHTKPGGQRDYDPPQKDDDEQNNL